MKDRAAEAIASFRETSSNIDLIGIFFILAFIVVAVLVFLILKNLLGGDSEKKKFIKLAQSKGLTEEEANFLYSIASKLKKDPSLVLKFKPAFEKVIHHYVNSVEEYNEELIRRIREKLKFNRVPRFSPLITTKDIEPLQKARITILKNMLPLEAILHDKDEKYMYWHLSDIDRIHPEFLDSDVEITFIRYDDGIYQFESRVDAIYMEQGKVILKVPHVLEMRRIQRRKHARVPVSIPVKIGILKVYENNLEKIHWIDGEILNISAGGLKVCIGKDQKIDIDKTVKEISVKFKLENVTITGKVKIVRETSEGEVRCYGMKFTELSSKYEEIIHDFVRKKQIEMKKIMD